MIRDKYKTFEEEISNLKEELNKLMEDEMEGLFKEQVAIDKEDIKNHGSQHYKTGGIEPIDLYESAGMLKHFALGNIIKYAFRNREVVCKKDMEKIIHYASMLYQMGLLTLLEAREFAKIVMYRENAETD